MQAKEPMANHDSAGVRFPPPLVFLGFALLGPLIGRFAGDRHFGGDWATLLGVALLGGGIALAALAMLRFRQNQTPIPPVTSTRVIVDTGVYAITRNPMYLALATMQLGLGVLLDSGWSALLVLASLAVIRTQVIAREEAYLTAKFGPVYRDYQARVPRWL